VTRVAHEDLLHIVIKSVENAEINSVQTKLISLSVSIFINCKVPCDIFDYVSGTFYVFGADRCTSM
jgi:hypothetical protein